MEKLIIEKIKENLCYYDKRNPDGHYHFNDEEIEKPENCKCENCFYGRTKLAEELLILDAKLTEIENKLNLVLDK